MQLILVLLLVLWPTPAWATASRDPDGVADYFSVGSALATGTPVTFACWGSSDDNTVLQTIAAISDTASNNNFFRMTFDGATAGDPITCQSRSAAANASSTVSGFTQDVWAHAGCIIASSTSRTAYVNGTAGTTNTTSVVPASLDTTALDAIVGTSAAVFFNGPTAACAMWNTNLTTAGMQTMAIGYPPVLLSVNNVLGYWPLTETNATDDAQDQQLANNLTATSSPPVSTDGPRVYWPQGGN